MLQGVASSSQYNSRPSFHPSALVSLSGSRQLPSAVTTAACITPFTASRSRFRSIHAPYKPPERKHGARVRPCRFRDDRDQEQVSEPAKDSSLQADQQQQQDWATAQSLGLNYQIIQDGHIITKEELFKFPQATSSIRAWKGKSQNGSLSNVWPVSGPATAAAAGVPSPSSSSSSSSSSRKQLSKQHQQQIYVQKSTASRQPTSTSSSGSSTSVDSSGGYQVIFDGSTAAQPQLIDLAAYSSSSSSVPPLAGSSSSGITADPAAAVAAAMPLGTVAIPAAAAADVAVVPLAAVPSAAAAVTDPTAVAQAEAVALSSPTPAAVAAGQQQQSFAIPVASSVPDLKSERLDIPPDSLALKDFRQLLASAVTSLGNPLEPIPGHEDAAAAQQQRSDRHAAAAAEDCHAAKAADTEAAVARPAAGSSRAGIVQTIPQNSLALQTREQLISSMLAAMRQVLDVGVDAVVEGTAAALAALSSTARSAVLTSASAVLAASSAGAVDRQQLKTLDLRKAAVQLRSDPDRIIAAGPDADLHLGRQYSASSSSSSSGVSSTVINAGFEAVAYIDQDGGPTVVTATAANSSSSGSSGVNSTVIDANFSAQTYIDQDGEQVLLSTTAASSSSSSSSGGSPRTPLANLEQSRLEVTKQLNLKREEIAQRLMKRTRIFATRLRESGKHTAKEMGPPIVRQAVAMIGRRTVVDVVKWLGRENTAVAVGLVGGEIAAAATEQLGVGGFVEMAETLGPKGMVKVVEELGPVQAAKLGRKLVIDNADTAVEKMREGLKDPKGFRGVLQNLGLKFVWLASFVWFGLVMVVKSIMQGITSAVRGGRGNADSSNNVQRPSAA